MEGPSRKRKISHDNEENHQYEIEDDEEKMEKFFALIKRIRETRETLIKCSGEFTEKENNKKKQNIVEEDRKKQIEVWKPSFRHEDFMENDGTHHVTLVGTSQVKEEGAAKDDDVKEALDLNLSL